MAGPKENTVKDFWRLVWQQDITQVVMLTNLMERGKVGINIYWIKNYLDNRKKNRCTNSMN